jgi:hypothetical protein
MDTLLNILILSAKAAGFIALFVFVVCIIIYIVIFLFPWSSRRKSGTLG